MCCSNAVTQGYFILVTCVKANHIGQAFTLAKHERLKSRKLLEQLFREGATLFVHPFKIYYTHRVPEGAPLQAGFGASSRIFKKAVDRNRIKRLAREAYRLQKEPLRDKRLAIFFLFVGKEIPDFGLVKEKIGQAIHKLSNH